MKWAEDEAHLQIIEESLVMAPALNYKTLRQLTILILITMILSVSASAQDCTPDDITLSAQAEVDNFQVNHGPCDTVMGGLHIMGSDIVDLLPLSALTSVRRNIFIGSNPVLTNLDGLSTLTNVGRYIYINFNPVLTNLDGLSALTSVGGLVIDSNDALTNLDGLSALASVDGYIGIRHNAALIDLDGLSALTNLGGELAIDDNDALTDLDGLSALTSVFRLVIYHNDALTNLDGLSALASSGGWIYIFVNDALTNLDGLSALTNVGGGLEVSYNAVLTNIDGLSALISVGQDVRIENNPSLAACTGLTELLDPIDDGAPGPGPGIAGIPDVAADLEMSGNLPGCNSAMEILTDTPLMKINAGLNDAWFNPETDGQGFFFIVFPEIEQMFIAWFTYDTERPPEDITAILGEPGHRWVTAQGGYEENVARLDVFVTAGGVFDSAQPEPITEQEGKILVEFSSCNSGVVTYDIPSIGRQGNVPIERVALDNFSLCYLLDNQPVPDEASESD